MIVNHVDLKVRSSGINNQINKCCNALTCNLKSYQHSRFKALPKYQEDVKMMDPIIDLDKEFNPSVNMVKEKTI